MELLMHGVNELKKVIKISIMSIIASFSITFALLIVNSFMKIFITIDYYFMFFSFMSIGLIISLIFYNSKSIFSNKKSKFNKKIDSKKIVRKTIKQKSQNQVRRRKIS